MASVGRWSRLNNAAPSLQPHYRAFVTTTGCSAPALRIGTLALAVVAACGLSLHHAHSMPSVVTPCRFSRSIRKPDRASRRLHAGCRSVGIRTSSELIPKVGSTLGFDIVLRLSTLRQRFTCVRLSRPCLPGSSSRRFRDAHHHGFWPQQLTVARDQRPDRRTRRALLHLSYSCASPCGPTMLVTHDPEPSSLQRSNLQDFHSITSSALSRMAGGSSRPSTLAVLRLTVSSRRVGCSTGRSAGLAPLMMRSTWRAAPFTSSSISGP
jgi:hypothetical protein